jgi:hypothetical protein
MTVSQMAAQQRQEEGYYDDEADYDSDSSYGTAEPEEEGAYSRAPEQASEGRRVRRSAGKGDEKRYKGFRGFLRKLLD